MNEYYFLDSNNQQQGPVTPSLFPQLGIKPETLVWRVGMEKWMPASEIPELKEFIIPPAQTTGYQDSYKNNNGYNGGYNNGMRQQLPPPSNLVWAILSTVLCCIPLGIVSIVYASQVESEWNMGRHERAWRKSNLARNWAIAAAVIGFITSIFLAFTGFFANLAAISSF